MNRRKLAVVVGGLVSFLVLVGVAGAFSGRLPALPATIGAAVSSGITYQGRLTDSADQPLNGTVTMRFVVYDDPVAGAAQWDSGNMNVSVQNGLFTVKLGVDASDFNGQALWLSIVVNGQTLSPRQEITAAPYALGLRPGSEIVGDAIGAGGAVLTGQAPATGTAFRAEANGGIGLYGNSQGNYGVWGASNNSVGGYFSSANGTGLRVSSDGTDHFDHGAHVTAADGYGIYVQSAQNQGVRSEAGDVTGISQPLGAVGVVGLGTNRGAYGASNSGAGLFGVSSSNYGVWGHSSTWRGVTGRTNNSDNNYGIYTPDNLYALNVQTSGSLMAVMQNGGGEPLSAGDVVAFSGFVESVPEVDGPLVQVSRASDANSTAVAGVVFSRFNIEAIDPALDKPDDSLQGKQAEVEVIPAGSAAPGEYVLVVVQGPAQVKVSALESNPIRPGDLMSAAGNGGAAAKAELVTVEGVQTAVPGTVFGKALQSSSGTDEMIYVYVTLQ